MESTKTIMALEPISNKALYTDVNSSFRGHLNIYFDLKIFFLSFLLGVFTGPCEDFFQLLVA